MKPLLVASSSVAWPRAAGRFGGRFGDGWTGGITQGNQDPFGASGAVALQAPEGLPKCLQAEVRFARAPIDPVEKRGQIDQLGTGLHKVKVESLLTCHNSA